MTKIGFYFLSLVVLYSSIYIADFDKLEAPNSVFLYLVSFMLVSLFLAGSLLDAVIKCFKK